MNTIVCYRLICWFFIFFLKKSGDNLIRSWKFYTCIHKISMQTIIVLGSNILYHSIAETILDNWVYWGFIFCHQFRNMQLLLLYFDCKCVNLSEFKFRVLMEHSVLGKLLDFYQHDENAQLKDCACICILKNKYRSFFNIIVYFFLQSMLYFCVERLISIYELEIYTEKSEGCWDCLYMYEELSPKMFLSFK